MGNLIEPAYGLTAEGTASAQTECARARIPNVNALATEVTGAARKNGGSYTLGAAGMLKTDGVGHALSLMKPFTVEGWLKWNSAVDAADEDLVVAGNPDGHGVRIFIDKSGATPRLKVKARGLWPCTPWIDTAFAADLTPYANEWTHFAVVYDPADYTGSWTLLAEGKKLGEKIFNFYHPSTMDSFRSGEFRLGSTVKPLAGDVDMWRLAEGTLGVEELLYAPKPGLLLLFR